MSSIVTFYSYKGGVGRSMALANIAVLLARRGLRVLTVDWDLEAPGLERYFSNFEIHTGGPGLLRMFMEARDRETADFRSFTCTFDCEGRYPVTLLASGRELDEDYSRNLERFDWEDFFANRGGHFVEHLRQQWREQFDIVLIDSRTGLSDTGGICTIQIPDIVVAMFTANYQSLFGVRDVMRLAQKARQGLAYDRMPLSILPLPARWGVQEFQETRVWLDRIAEGVKEFCEDWLPGTLRVRDVVESLKIPQIAYFSFGEKLAVVEQGTSDPQGMGFVYHKVASFLASDFKDLGVLVGEDAVRQAHTSQAATPPRPTSKPPDAPDYLYDIFVSHDGSMPERILEFTELLIEALTEMRKEPPRVFVDTRVIKEGSSWDDQLREALTRSKVLVAMITPRYHDSHAAQMELETFTKRPMKIGQPPIIQVLVRGDNLPFSKEGELFDLRKYPQLKASSTRPGGLHREILDLARVLDNVIDEAPSFDPLWLVGSAEQPGRPPTRTA
jgi:MinD-like ATPase involved in chromosome partitioning or flagellar assembly